MKFKQQEESQEQPQEKNKFLEMVAATMALNREFQYAVTCYKSHKEGDLDLCHVTHGLDWDFDDLMKLYTSLDKSHSYPNIKTNQKSASDLKELVELEEQYYNAIVALGETGLNENNIQVVAHTSNMIVRFKHTFCELLHESDSTL